MDGDGFLFDVRTPRLSAGRVRKGLDRDVAEAKAAGVDLRAAGVAALRTLADQIDQLERFLRSKDARPYDRIPLSGLVRQFDDTYGRVFAALDARSDPLAAALADFLEAERPATDDTAGQVDPK
jgi:hypothetical protein